MWFLRKAGLRSPLLSHPRLDFTYTHYVCLVDENSKKSTFRMLAALTIWWTECMCKSVCLRVEELSREYVHCTSRRLILVSARIRKCILKINVLQKSNIKIDGKKMFRQSVNIYQTSVNVEMNYECRWSGRRIIWFASILKRIKCKRDVWVKTIYRRVCY